VLVCQGSASSPGNGLESRYQHDFSSN
jgi:hypothetical protein